MFALTPLAVALQGIGFGTLLTSLQGLLAVTVAPIDDEQTGGLMGASSPRHRVRRWTPFSAVPPPWELMQKTRRRNTQILLAMDAL